MNFQIRLPAAASLAFAALFCFATAHAQTIDQEEPAIDASAGFLGIGGDSQQKLAQTFTVGADGRLIAVDIPVTCGGADVIIELRRLGPSGKPDGALLRVARRTFPSGPPGEFRRTYFPTPVEVTAGERLAFTIRMANPGDSCNYGTSPTGDAYAGGQGYFDARPNPPGWLAMRGLDPYDDIPFKTVLEGPGAMSDGQDCIINTASGPVSLPGGRYTAVCRCLSDAGLREFRCGIMTEDFFLWRRLHIPVRPGMPYTEIWEFFPAAPLDAPVRLTISGDDVGKAMTHVFGLNPKKGSERFIVKGIAPKNMKAFNARATIDYDMKGPVAKGETHIVVDRSLGISPPQK